MKSRRLLYNNFFLVSTSSFTVRNRLQFSAAVSALAACGRGLYLGKCSVQVVFPVQLWSFKTAAVNHCFCQFIIPPCEVICNGKICLICSAAIWFTASLYVQVKAFPSTIVQQPEFCPLTAFKDAINDFLYCGRFRGSMGILWLLWCCWCRLLWFCFRFWLFFFVLILFCLQSFHN